MTLEEKLKQAGARHGKPFHCNTLVQRVTPPSNRLQELRRAGGKGEDSSKVILLKGEKK